MYLIINSVAVSFKHFSQSWNKTENILLAAMILRDSRAWSQFSQEDIYVLLICNTCTALDREAVVVFRVQSQTHVVADLCIALRFTKLVLLTQYLPDLYRIWIKPLRGIYVVIALEFI